MAAVVPGNEQDQPGYQMPGLAAAATSQPQLGPTAVRNQAGQVVVYDPRRGEWTIPAAQGATPPAALMSRGGFEPPAAPTAPTAAPAPQASAGVPVPPSLAPIYKRESGFNYTAQNPTSSAAGAGQDIDSTWREAMHGLGYGDQWKHAKEAPPEIQNAANIWLQGRYGNKPWAASDPATRAFGRAYQDQSRRDYETAREQTQTVLAEMNKASPNSDTYRKLIGQALERSDELQTEFMNTMRHPPVQKPADVMSNFGSLATVIGIFGGLFSRRPLTAALNAAGAGMQAMNAGNHEAYQRAYDTWKTQTTLLHEILSEQNSQIRNVLELESIDEREKMDRINILATQFGQDRLAAAAQRGDLREVYAFNQQAQLLPGKLAEQTAQIESFNSLSQERRQKSEMERSIYGDVGGSQSSPPAGEQASATTTPTPPGGKTGAAAHDPNSAPAGVSQALWDAATSYVLTGKMPALGWSAQGRMAVLALEPKVRDARKMSNEDMIRQWASYAGTVSGSRVLDNRIANLSAGMHEVPPLGQALIDASKKVPRVSSVMTVNKLLQAYELQTGDPNIVRLGAALNSYLNAYARAINPTGRMTDQQQGHAYEILNKAMSQGQIEAGVAQLGLETQAMLEGLKQAAGGFQDTFPVPGEQGAVPTDLPSPIGLPEGQSAIDDTTGETFVIRGGTWSKPR